MTPQPKDRQESLISQTEFQVYVREQMRAALPVTLPTVLAEELTALIGAGRYEQTSERRDHRNGSYERDLLTSVGLLEDLAVPRSRQGHQTQLFDLAKKRQQQQPGLASVDRHCCCCS